MFTAHPAPALWQQHRDQFPVTEKLVYLNHAGVAPLCRAAVDAMKAVIDDAFLFGSYHYEQWLDAYEGLRVATASLLNAHRDEIAIVKNTSEGIATIAMGLDWRPVDAVVAFREEFPANFFPWKRLESRGVEVRWLSIHDPLDRIDAACRGARLLAISYVNYLSGHRMDLEALGEICHRHGTFFFVDAIQGLGAFPLDVRRARIHALAADGHKWLLGPEGCGVLYIQKDQQDAIFPEEFGWTNIAGYNDYACRDMKLRPDAGRYECGTLNTVGICGLRASMEFLLGIGVPQVGQQILELCDDFAENVTAKGYELLGQRTPETGSGIVTFRKPGVDSRRIVRDLKDAGFMPAPRQGYVRVSPHFYTSPDELARLVDLLP